MLVCGWADSTMMMMSGGQSLQPTAVRSATIFHHIGPPFFLVNALNAIVALGTLLPLLLCPPSAPMALVQAVTGGGGGGDLSDGGDGGDEEEWLVHFSLWLSDVSGGCFSVLLAASSIIAGTLVSYKIRNIAEVEPALRSFAHEKMLKVILAAFVFSSCTLARAYVLLRNELQPGAPPLTPLGYLGLGVVLPEILPTLAALLVLRRRPIAGCAKCTDEDRHACCCGCCWPGRKIGGVDPRPLIAPS
jgi:hypothetical protein